MTDPSAAVLSSFSSALAELVARTKPAIVSVHSHRSRASGFVWKPGLIVTADEALADEGEVSVKLADGTTRPASVAGRDHTTDIALLRFDGQNIAPVALASVVPDLGSLSVVVAAEHGAPTAALGTVSLVGEPLAKPARRRDRRQNRTRRAAAAQPRGGPRGHCLRRSDWHGCPGSAACSCHSERDDRPGRRKT